MTISFPPVQFQTHIGFDLLFILWKHSSVIRALLVACLEGIKALWLYDTMEARKSFNLLDITLD